MRWKLRALAAFAIPLFLFAAVASPVAFAATIALQTFLGIALSNYFKIGL